MSCNIWLYGMKVINLIEKKELQDLETTARKPRLEFFTMVVYIPWITYHKGPGILKGIVSFFAKATIEKLIGFL